MTASYRLLIGGQLVDGASRFDVINPATETVLASCPKADEAQLEAAVRAARDAFPAWAATTQDARAALVQAIADRLLSRAEAFAHLLTAEQGKPLDQAHAEVMGTVFTLKAFAEMRITDKVLVDEPGHRVIEHRTPLGVCAAITPWNFLWCCWPTSWVHA
jgi:acyl-CoA reductase-like NAD-dependent aldehyde dehydrogenase